MDRIKSVHKNLRGTSIVALYFVQEGLLYRCFHGLSYPWFGQYLNIEGHQYNSLRSLFSLAWSMKIFFSFFSDSIPLFGYRRIPYITLGLLAILAALATLSFKPMPEPYYRTENCTRLKNEEPLNPDAPNAAFVYTLIFFLWYCGLSCSDAVIDALMTQRSKLEPEEKRGTLISYTRITSQIGATVALLSVGFLLNGPKYGGDFCHFGIEFNQFMWIPFSVTVLGIVYAFLYTNEKDVDDKKEEVQLKSRLKDLWLLFHRWNYLKLLVFALIIAIQWSLRSPAGIKVQMHWAGVRTITVNLVSILTGLIGGLGMIIYLRCFLNSNWRLILLLVVGIQILTELPVVTMTIFDVIRNEYFWFVDDVFDAVIRFWFSYIIELVIVEYAPDGIEGISYALIWAIVNIGRAIGSALANFIMSPFCLTDNFRYVRDSTNDRTAVWTSYMISFGFQILGLFSVLLIPNQKKQAKEWREQCEQEESGKSWNAVVFVSLSILGLVGGTVLNLMTMFESTRCMMIAGGPGCGGAEFGASSCILYN